MVVRGHRALAGIRALVELVERQVRRAPVAHHQVRAADVQDSDLARLDDPSVVCDHERLGPGNRLADGGRLLVDQAGVEVADPDALGLAVHAVELRVRKDPAQAVVQRRREAGGGVRQTAHGGVRRVLGHGEDRGVDGRDGRKDGRVLLAKPRERLRGERERALEGERRAEPRGEQQLAEAVRERHREDAQDPVVPGQPQVLGDALDREHEPCVAVHYALRLAGRARRVDEDREVVRDRVPRAAARAAPTRSPRSRHRS